MGGQERTRAQSPSKMDDRYGMPVPDTDKREIGDLATWSVATAKSANGVEMLRDNNGETYWQCAPRPRQPRSSLTCLLPLSGRTEGLATWWTSPSSGEWSCWCVRELEALRALLMRARRLQELAVYADFKLDESYTPKLVSVRVGNSVAELREVASLTLDEPTGWVFISLTQPVEGKAQCVAGGRTRAARSRLTPLPQPAQEPACLPRAAGAAAQPPGRQGHAPAPGEDFRAAPDADGPDVPQRDHAGVLTVRRAAVKEAHDEGALSIVITKHSYLTLVHRAC